MPSIPSQLTIALDEMLNFYHKGVVNITRPGYSHRVGDTIGFQVFVRNLSTTFTMTNVHGSINHAPATLFTSVNFSVPALAPGEEKSLGPQIQAKVVRNTNDVPVFQLDKIALVGADATAELGSLTFHDSGFLIDALSSV